MKTKLLVICLSSIVFIYTSISLYKIITTTAPDFSVFYYATQDILRLHNPYTDKSLFTVFNYPVITSIVFSPFALIPYQFAQGVFILLSWLSLLLIIYVSLKLVNKLTRQIFLFCSSLALLSFPVKFTFGMGQSNLIAYALLLSGFYFYQQKKILFTVLLLTLAIIFKPVFCFLLLFFLLQKSWKVFFITSITLVFCNFITLLLDYNDTLFYIISVVPHLFTTTGREVYYNQGILGFISRLTGSLLLRGRITMVSNLGIVSYLTVKRRADLNLLFSLFLITLVLVDSLSWQHHFVFLIFPFIVVGEEILKQKNKVAISLLIFAYVLVNANIKHPQTFNYFPVNILLSHVFYGAILLFGILVLKIFEKKEN